MVPTLTTYQQQIIAHQSGHARVVAVAGAGKTTTLTHFIAARLAQGVPVRRMLVLMYNRNARSDFELKLKRILPNQAHPEIRTFHSLALRIYQRLIAQQDLPAFVGKPLSDGEMENVLWRIMQSLADDDTKQDILSQRKKWVEPALSFVDLVKAGLDSPELVFEQTGLPANCNFFVPMFHEFEAWRKQQRRISYADMLYDVVQLFVRKPAIAAQFGGHMQWILVDEYQDINAIQQYLLDVLYAGRGSVMVIGDPDQTIYEFRGSRPEFLVKTFGEKMGQIQHYVLPHTFRYGHALSLLANQLISHNQERDDVLCLSHPSTPNTQVKLHQVRYEAPYVLAMIQNLAATHSLNDIAIINRLWALCAPIELALLQAGIPYRLHHSLSVLDRFELKLFYFLFEIAAGVFAQKSAKEKQDDWLNLLTTPYPKVKRQLLEQLAQKMATVEANFGEHLSRFLPKELSPWQAQTLQARAEIISAAEHLNVPAYKLVNDYIQASHLFEGIAENGFSAQQIEDRIQTIKAFAFFMKENALPSDQALAYLQQLKAKRSAQNQNEGVELISIHKSKGLEWPVVIIPGLNEHYYPYTPEGEFTTPSSDESERRLLYVAMTRAKNELHLIAPQVQAKGKKLEQDKKPSRFEAELQVQSCLALAQALVRGESELELTAEPPVWLEGYLAGVGAKLTVKAAKKSFFSRTKFNPIASKKFTSAKGRSITHQSLGCGEVIYEDEKYLKVLFEGENQPRTLDKKAVQAFLL